MRRSLAVLRLLRQNPNHHRAAAYSTAATPTPTPTPASTPTPTLTPTPSPHVSAIVDEICSLTLLEASSLSTALQSRLGVDQLPIFALLSPGAAPSFGSASAGAASTATEEKKEEKTSFDLKLESFEAASKIKVIKEVRGFTDLGLKEAKELVEKAPMVIKKGVTKEEAEKIVAKMKEIGAKVVLE